MTITKQRHLKLVPAAPPRTASINIRLSKKAGESNLSRAGMEADCRALCARHGIDVRYVHVDEVSGAIRNRKGFLAWLADGREGRVDTLVAFHVDRMTREGVNVAAMMLDVVEGKDPTTGAVVRHPVRLIDCKGLDSEGDTTAFRFQLVIAAEVARGERERMSDRSQDMHRRFKAEGKVTGGPLPFGFQLKDRKTRRLVPLPDQARYLREAAEQVWTIGTPEGVRVTVGSVVRWMNGPQGCKPLRAKAWSRTTLIQCLTRTPECVDEDIFTPDERASLRSILATPGTPTKAAGKRGGRAGKRIASGGLLQCKGCESTMTIHPRVRTVSKKAKAAGIKGVKVDDYRCSAQPGACPRGSAVFAEFMDDHLRARHLYECGDEPEYVRRATVTGYAAIEEAELSVSDALDELKVQATPEAFARLQSAQLLLQEALALPQVAQVHWEPTGRTIQEAWDAGSVLDQQGMLRDHWSKIIVGPGKKGQRSIDLTRLDFVPHPDYASARVIAETAGEVQGRKLA